MEENYHVNVQIAQTLKLRQTHLAHSPPLFTWRTSNSFRILPRYHQVLWVVARQSSTGNVDKQWLCTARQGMTGLLWNQRRKKQRRPHAISFFYISNLTEILLYFTYSRKQSAYGRQI